MESVQDTTITPLDQHREADNLGLQTSENGTPTGETQKIQELTLVEQFALRRSVEHGLNQTWQRRMITERVAKSNEPEKDYVLTPERLRIELFGNEGLADGFASGLKQKLVNETSKLKRKELEKYLWLEVEKEIPNIGRFLLKDFSPKLFSKPGCGRLEIEQAEKYLRDHPDASITDLFTDDTTPEFLNRPPIESILDAIRLKLTSDMGIAIKTDSEKASEYYSLWIQEQQALPGRIVFSPTYRETANAILEQTRRNSKSRTIARSVLYGPPGQGKTEFFRALNRMEGKDTVVITARPHLGFEELIGAPEIIPQGRVKNFAELAGLYKGLDAQLAVRALYKSSEMIANKQIEKMAGDLDDEKVTIFKQGFRKTWLRDICGLTEDMASWLSSRQNKDEIVPLQTEAFTFVEIQKTFMENLTAEGTTSLSGSDERATSYLKGLILMADELGARVVIDEAEKLYGDSPGASRSFAGLEDVLTKSPGGVIKIGNIEHRVSDDFYIDLSVNKLSVPEHVKSRFGSRLYYIHANTYDRLAIATVGTAGEDGLPCITAEEQARLIYFIGFVWPAIESHLTQFPEDEREAFDLRTLSGILGGLSHEGEPQRALVQLVEELKNPEIRNSLSRFVGIQPEIGSLMQLLMQETSTLLAEQVSYDNGSMLVKMLKMKGEGTLIRNRTLSSGHLHPEQVSALQEQVNVENTAQTATRIETGSGIMTLDSADPNNKRIIISHPIDDSILYEAHVKDPTGNEPMQLVETDLWGTVVLCKKGDSYNVYDINRAKSQGFGDDLSLAVEIMPEIKGASLAALSPLGNDVYYIDADGMMQCQPLGFEWTTDEKGEFKTSLKPKIRIDAPKARQISDVKISRDGQFALVTADNGTHLLDLMYMSETGSPRFLTGTTPLEGKYWQVETFEDVVWLFNPVSKKGLTIT